jgi:hypothetical protein
MTKGAPGSSGPSGVWMKNTTAPQNTQPQSWTTTQIPVISSTVMSNVITINSSSSGTGSVVGLINSPQSWDTTDPIKFTLERDGLDLGNNRRLKLIDGEPVIVHHHTDGRETHDAVNARHRGVIDFTNTEHALLSGTTIKLPDGEYLHIDKDGTLIKESYLHARDRTVDVTGGNTTLYESLAFCDFREIKIPDGVHSNATFILPNDVKIHLFADDHIEIDESDGHQIYKTAPVRGFNKYLNASDLMEDFVRYCATQKITRREFQNLPISLFICWIILESAKADGDPTEESQLLLDQQKKTHINPVHRCRCCGKFISPKLVEEGVNFCSSAHMDRHLQRKGLSNGRENNRLGR